MSASSPPPRLPHNSQGKEAAMPIKNILVVDDSPTDRQYLSDLLAKSGYAVTIAESAEEAFAKVKLKRPDLVLMDVVMPGQNGYQATRVLSKDASTKDIPVIICTTKGQETDKIWGMRQGARDYIVKPVNGPELLAKITALG
jgi:twitching motility two-component system response regulator PilH